MSAIQKTQIESALAALDHQWHADQARYLKQTPTGGFEPPRQTNISKCILLMVGSVVGMAFLTATSLPPFVAYLGFIPFALGTFQLLVGSSKAEALERCRIAYETQRAQLLRKLEEVPTNAS